MGLIGWNDLIPGMNHEIFSLHLTAEDLLDYYRGHAPLVVVTAESGRTIQFPAVHLRPLIQSNGIHGRFRITYDGEMKFQSLEAVSRSEVSYSTTHRQPRIDEGSTPNGPPHIDTYG